MLDGLAQTFHMPSRPPSLPSGPMLNDLGQPFRMLAGYIFGGNAKRTAAGGAEASSSKAPSEAVAMTSPVLMTQRAPEPPKAASEAVAMTSPVLMTQQAAGGEKKMVKRMVRGGNSLKGAMGLFS